jgi:hypothetical protein
MAGTYYDFNPYKLSPDLLSAIGLTIASASQTEEILNMAIGGMLGLDSEYTIAVTQHMPLPLKLSVLHSAAEIRLDDLDALDELDTVLDEVKSALDKRNEVAHDSWARVPGTEETHRIKQKARVRVEVELHPVEVEAIITDARAINQAGLNLVSFLSAHGLHPIIPEGSRPRGHKTKAARKARRAKMGK